MLFPRILFQGDPAQAAKWVGYAKNLARQLSAANIRGKTFRLGEDVTIRVDNYSETISKILITTGGGTSGGYQFYTTSPTVQWAINTDAENDFFPGGSSVYVPTPKQQEIDGILQYVIKAYPTGSLVDAPPTVNGVPLWRYSEMPTYLTGEGGLNQKMREELFKFKGAWQVDGIPQYMYYRCEGSDLKPKVSVYQSWVQAQGQIHGCGAIVPIDYTYSTDFQYDAAPTQITGKKKIESFVPDTDWFGRGCVQYVSHPEYGTRGFFILSDTENRWHCYPLSGFTADVAEYSAQYAAYGDQGYKANIIPDHAKSDAPAYPSWVAVGVSWRDVYKEDPDKLILEPRYSWSFNQNGTQAISVMIERKDSECTFAEIDYAPDGLGIAVFEMFNGPDPYVEDPPPPIPLDSPHVPTEIDIDEILIDQSDNLGKAHNPKKTQVDRRGWVEVEFSIELTGLNIDNFTFEVVVVHSYSPDDLLITGNGVLVDVAYAMPMQWDRVSFGVRDLTNSVFTVQVDDILSTWIKLYRHQDQISLIAAYDGEASMNEPSKARTTFYKGSNPASLTQLFVLPLYQTHGAGYTFSIPPLLPPEPHLFVRQTSQSFISRYPWEPLEGESPKLYKYDAKITHLDLRSLSFYYTVRLLEQSHDETAHDLTGGVYIRNKARTWCAVCVMGKIVQEESVGHDDLPVNWIQGWVKEAGLADLDDDEFETPVDLIGKLRGCGFLARNTNMEYTPATILYDTEPENQYVATDAWGKKSWVNSIYMQLSPFRDRGEYTTSYIDELPVPPWFMIGPCYHIFCFAIALCDICNDYPDGFTEWIGEETYVSRQFDPFMPLKDMEEEHIPDFIEYVYTLYSTFSVHYVFIGDGVSSTRDETLLGYYTENPFILANPDIVLEDFKLDAARYVWQIIKSTQKYSEPMGQYSIDISQLPVYIDNFIFPRGGGLIQYRNQNQLIDPYDNIITKEQFRKQKIVKNFELGNMYYNTAISRHFTPSPIHSLDAIHVTPEGHYSFSRKDLFEISKEYCTQDVKYYNDKLRSYETPGGPNLLYDFSTGAMPLLLRLEPIPDQNLTAADMDWKLLEGIHWFYGEAKTTHLAVYNLAYQRVAPEYKKSYLLSEEEFENYYSKNDFIPYFGFLDYNNFLWVYPGDAEDGRPLAAFYRSLQSSHNTSTSSYPKFDGRPGRQHIRLSPLFF